MGPVQDIVATVVNERDLLFVLHLDGHLRIWDNHMKLLNYNVHSNDIEGNVYVLFTCCSLDLVLLPYCSLLWFFVSNAALFLQCMQCCCDTCKLQSASLSQSSYRISPPQKLYAIQSSNSIDMGYQQLG